LKRVMMMSIINDKISFFAKIIYEKMDDENKNALDLFKAEKEKQISEFEKSSEEKRNKEIIEVAKKAQFKANEIAANEKSISKQQIMLLRENLIGKTIEALKNEFLNYIETPEYESFLLELVKQIIPTLDEGEYWLYATDKDFRKYKDKINEALVSMHMGGIELGTVPLPIIGGIIVEEKNKRFALDNSISSIIEENKPYIGLKVSELLDLEAKLIGT
jgi:vacuolar-type H+-ATPase subunit E/Vma4